METANTIHISALGDRDDCAQPMVRRFVRTLSAGDTSCARRIAEVRTVDAFPRRVAAAEPARPRTGRSVPLPPRAVRARLRLPGRGRLRARWSTQRPLAVAVLDGRLGGRKLRATMLAP
jgi:hypothetical protein